MKLYLSLLWLSSLTVSLTYGYELTSVGDISLTDEDTGLSGLATIFTGEPTKVTVGDLEWDSENTANSTLRYETFINDKSVNAGEMALDQSSMPPSSVDVGTILLENGNSGTTTIRVEFSTGSSSQSTSADFQAFRNGVAIIPLLVVLFFAATTRIVRSWRACPYRVCGVPSRRAISPHSLHLETG